MSTSDPRDYLWENLLALVRMDAASVDFVTQKAKVGRGSVQRISERQAGTRLSTLLAIASEFDIEVWQLLVPGLDPDNLPSLSSGRSSASRFSSELLAACVAADPEALRRAENAARNCLDLDPLPRIDGSKAIKANGTTG